MDDVLVVGAGPVGLTLAAELARHGVTCRIVDRLTVPLPYCRAIGVTPRTMEVWEDMGVVPAMIDAGLWLDGMRSVIGGQAPQDAIETYPDLPYGHLGLPQNDTERVLAAHLRQFGIGVEKGVTLTALSQDAESVSLQMMRADGAAETIRARYVVGCDGAHSVVRKALGIDFVGEALPWPFMLGDVHIAWDQPRHLAYRALKMGPNGLPQIFVAIPLPEPGRYRVSMFAPPEMAPPERGEHGIQAESPGPSLEQLQEVADALIPGKPVLSDPRWSSVFRISMRLASAYRVGRGFIAGDAAHIHPPTGGQGMNTGIQDAYNLAWKMALVLRGKAPVELLESYDAERRPVGADVLARTKAATENFGRESTAPKPHRLDDTQLLISYSGSGWVDEDGAGLEAGPVAGDRAPDAAGLRRRGLGFPLRLFEMLRGTSHVLVVHAMGIKMRRDLPDLSALAGEWRARYGDALRVVAIVATDDLPEPYGFAMVRDGEGGFRAAYGGQAACFLMRPDGYIGWRGRAWRDAGLVAYLDRVLA